MKQVEEWLAKNNAIPYEETSALEGQNVEQSFNKIAHKLLKNTLASSETTIFPKLGEVGGASSAGAGTAGASTTGSTKFALNKQKQAQGKGGKKKSNCC